jgi:hypothetical protein
MKRMILFLLALQLLALPLPHPSFAQSPNQLQLEAASIQSLSNGQQRWLTMFEIAELLQALQQAQPLTNEPREPTNWTHCIVLWAEQGEVALWVDKQLHLLGMAPAESAQLALPHSIDHLLQDH